jgi:hypothetical protein
VTPSTVVDLTPLIQALAGVVATLVLAFSTVAIHRLNTWLAAKTGQQNLINEDQIRSYLSDALTNAVHYAVSQAGAANWDHPDVKSSLVKSAIEYAMARVPDAINYFKLDEADLEKLISSKLNQILPLPATTTVPTVAVTTKGT